VAVAEGDESESKAEPECNLEKEAAAEVGNPITQENQESTTKSKKTYVHY
jgi:hypothetical protein